MKKVILFILALLLSSWLVIAFIGETGPDAPPVRKPQITGMWVLEDATRQMGLQQVMASRSWQQVRSEGFSGGYTRSAYWLRLRIDAASAREVALTVLPAFLDDVRFYLPASTVPDAKSIKGQAPWRVIQQGDYYPRNARTYEWRASNVRFAVAQQEAAVDVYLRVQTGSTSLIHPQVWTEQGFATYRYNEYLVFGVAIGITALFVLLSAGLWWIHREEPYGLYMLFATSCLSWYLTINGFVAELFLSQHPVFASNLLGFNICLTLGTGALFLHHIMEMRYWMPRFARVFVWYNVAVAMLAPLALVGWYQYFAEYLMIGMLAQWGAPVALGLWLMFKRRGLSRYSMLMYAVIIFGNTVMISGFLFKQAPPEYTVYLMQIITFADLFFLLPVVFLHAQKIQAEKRQAETDANLANQKLEIEMQATEARRQWVSIMTHEVKTPLAVIDASRQSIEVLTQDAHVHARTAKIERATQRIDNLVKSLLMEDEVPLRLQQLSLAEVDMEALLQRVVQDVDQTGGACRERSRR